MGGFLIDNGKELVSPADDDRFKIVRGTGLHDKNGTWVYEGDIAYHTKGLTMAVEYGNYAQFRVVRKGTSWALNGEFLEVIGNIHQNPELVN